MTSSVILFSLTSSATSSQELSDRELMGLKSQVAVVYSKFNENKRHHPFNHTRYGVLLNGCINSIVTSSLPEHKELTNIDYYADSRGLSFLTRERSKKQEKGLERINETFAEIQKQDSP